jgi:hypothetical protein
MSNMGELSESITGEYLMPQYHQPEGVREASDKYLILTQQMKTDQRPSDEYRGIRERGMDSAIRHLWCGGQL